MTRLIFALCTVTLLGCDALLGIEELPRGVVTLDGGGDAADTGRPPNTACIACESNTCSSQRSACLGDGACAPLLQCLDTCEPGNPVCRIDCERLHAAGVQRAQFREMDLCRRQSCVNECFGVAGFGTALDQTPACSCMDTACSAEMLACIQSGVAAVDSGVMPAGSPGACDRRLACMARTANPDGYVNCVMDNIAGGSEANALLDCMRKTNCPGEDGGPSCSISEGMYACKQKFTYGNQRNEFIDELTIGLIDLSRNPIVGAQVIACAASKCAPDCTRDGIGVTDATGKAVLKVKVTEGGFDGCVFIPQFKDNMPMNIVPGRHVNRSEAMITSYVLPEGILEVYASGLKEPLLRDPDHGHVLVAVHDCLWGRAAGVSLEMDGTDSATKVGYLRGSFVEPGAKETTSSGAAAYINVPIGTRTIHVLKGGVEIARQSITVRARELTDVNIYPLEKGR